MGDEACCAQRVFVASRAAVVDLYGDAGLKAVGERLGPDVRAALVDTGIIAEKWLPERFVMAWQEAVWEGPTGRRDDEFRRYVRRVVDGGFGRVRRLLLNLVTPATLCTRAAELWHDEHTHGEISARAEGNVVIVKLRKHPYVTRPVARLVLAEGLRHAASLTRAKRVEQAHRVENDTLEVRLTWA